MQSDLYKKLSYMDQIFNKFSLFNLTVIDYFHETNNSITFSNFNNDKISIFYHFDLIIIDNNAQFSMICLKKNFTIHRYRYIYYINSMAYKLIVQLASIECSNEINIRKGVLVNFNRFIDIQYKRKMNNNRNTPYKKSHCQV